MHGTKITKILSACSFRVTNLVPKIEVVLAFFGKCVDPWLRNMYFKHN
jgi:hypothetical protein